MGGFGELYHKYLEATPSDGFLSPADNSSVCGAPRADSWMLLRDARHSDMPWPAFLLGQTPASIWYWCADQVRGGATVEGGGLMRWKGWS